MTTSPAGVEGVNTRQESHALLSLELTGEFSHCTPAGVRVRTTGRELPDSRQGLEHASPGACALMEDTGRART